MTSEEVSAFSASVDVQAVREYWDAVGQRTVAVIRERGASGWDDRVDPERIRRTVIEEGDYGPNVPVDRVLTLYGGMTRGWSFAHLVLTHTYGHFYEGTVVRGSLGFPGV